MQCLTVSRQVSLPYSGAFVRCVLLHTAPVSYGENRGWISHQALVRIHPGEDLAWIRFELWLRKVDPYRNPIWPHHSPATFILSRTSVLHFTSPSAQRSNIFFVFVRQNAAPSQGKGRGSPSRFSRCFPSGCIWPRWPTEIRGRKSHLSLFGLPRRWMAHPTVHASLSLPLRCISTGFGFGRKVVLSLILVQLVHSPLISRTTLPFSSNLGPLTSGFASRTQFILWSQYFQAKLSVAAIRFLSNRSAFSMMRGAP